MIDVNIRSPKQVTLGTRAVERRWYPYYAGYAPGFVDDVLRSLAFEPRLRVIDPWNGSGTTTSRAAAAGHQAWGIDINPVLVLVARGRVLGSNVLDSIPALTDEIADTTERVADADNIDPLNAWFTPAGASRLRQYEMAIQRVLIDHGTYTPLASRGLGGVSSLASFMYVALFATCRRLLRAKQGTNPTWMRTPREQSDKVSFPSGDVDDIFREESRLLIAYLRDQLLSERDSNRVTVELGNSEIASIGDGQFDIMMGSPPYCTRIDYAVATAPELAILGYDERALTDLRNEMMGTPTVGHHIPAEEGGEWGPTVSSTLESISRHPSKASATYYLKYYQRYFASLWRSMRNLSAQASDDARMCLVVQESNYKDLRIDLSQITIEMAELNGWRSDYVIPFEVPRTRAAMNPRARKYRSDFKAFEDVLIFSRN